MLNKDKIHKTTEVNARLVMVALLAADRTLQRLELHAIINQSRASWPITNGELTDAIKLLRSCEKVKVAIRQNCFFDSASTQISLGDTQVAGLKHAEAIIS